MKVLLASTSVDVASAQDVARTALAPWAGYASAAPVSDGTGDLTAVVSHYLPGKLTSLKGYPITVLEAESQWVADLAEAWDGRALAALLRSACEARVPRLVVNLPAVAYPDLGQAMMGELGLETADDLARFMGPLDLLVTMPSPQPLLGVNGIPRLLDRRGELSPEEAQELEIDLGSRLPRPHRGLLMGSVDAKSDFSGGGGGVALLLMAAGGRCQWAGQFTADLARGAVTDPDLVVYVTGDVGLDMPRSLIALSQWAQSESIPAIIVYRDGALLRHELATFGLSGSYSYAGNGLAQAMSPIAATWLGPLLRS